MAYICDACSRAFGGLTGFDRHQLWAPGKHSMFDLCDGCPMCTDLQLTCQDPATMTRKDGSPLFKLDSHGRWVLYTGKPHPYAEPGGQTDDRTPSPCCPGFYLDGTMCPGCQF